jgi:hypothetical protein
MANGQGASLRTGKKEQFFALCLAWHMKQEARFLATFRTPQPYFHLDLNAGAGYNELVRHEGTPIIFMRQAVKYPQLAMAAQFVERNGESVERLRSRMAGQFARQFNGSLFGMDRSFSIIRGDNEERLIRFVQEVVPSLAANPRTARGSIISDPNGWTRSGGAVNLRTLKAALAALPRMLVLIFFPFAQAKRCDQYKMNGEQGPVKNIETRNVCDFLPMRRYWLVSKQGAYVYLCGSASLMPEGTPYVPAFRHDSPTGRAILDECSTIQQTNRRAG